MRLSASLSPPLRAASEDGKGSEKDGRAKRGRTVEAPEIDLSRASPFGPLSQVTARRTFAYLIATLNASHPDYDFSHVLRPRDFRKERSLRAVMHNIDSTLQSLRPRQTAAMNFLSPPTLSHSAPTGLASEVWNPNMWRMIEKEMGLRQCERYSYAPDNDPFDGEEGSIWSMHYFFYNKERKRVCYLYMRAFSVISHSPVHAPAMWWPRKKALAAGSLSFSAAADDDDGATKRATYWLGSRGAGAVGYGEYDDDDEQDPYVPDYEDEVEVPFMNLDDIRSDLLEGRYSATYDDDEDGDEYYTYDEPTWKDKAAPVRRMSEEIGAVMELDA